MMIKNKKELEQTLLPLVQSKGWDCIDIFELPYSAAYEFRVVKFHKQDTLIQRMEIDYTFFETRSFYSIIVYVFSNLQTIGYPDETKEVQDILLMGFKNYLQN